MSSERFDVGQRVRFHGPSEHARLWWTVQAVSDRFAVLTAPAPFKPKGTLMYTACDFEQGVRGAVNLIGGGYGDGSYTRAECERMLADLQDERGRDWVEVSHRNRVPLRLREHVGA